ncbi:hypothetical protein DYB37_002697 [Aphanomyces astaci]|uniref:Uncharacterized protein n=2 Tax=Aphanomyces astaci TaxID=112090 RepID=A0A3R6WBV1_APHAT|nr:hypothetical protein DYB35_002578 [Aphanomyces astaci]RHZ24667.1 hypothetical protein DYB37_002697 [Aphanomyces astaci]
MARKGGKGKGAAKRKAPLDVYEHGDTHDDLKEQRENDRMDVDGVYEYEAPEKISRDQDSEIDEDEAFNSDDDATFGTFFSGGNKKANAQGGGKSSADSDDNTVDDDVEDEDAGDLLSDMLGTAPASRLDTADDSGDDSDDDEDDDDDEKHASLLKMVHSAAKGPKRKFTHAETSEDVAPSAFSKKLGGSALTLEGLLGASITGLPGDDDGDDDDTVQSSTAVKSLKQQLAHLEKDDSKLQAPAAPVVEARASRKVAYTDKKKQMDVFQPVVKANREKETLDFRAQGTQRVENLTVASLTSKFVPEKPLENDVAALLEASGWSDKTMLKEEAAELAANEVSVDEVRARQGELAKMRAMMFYQEQKNKRIKKIKSKLYHKIRNKQEDRKERMALRELDPEFAAQMDADEAEKRAEERMTLKHTNTSKWVKHQLGRGIGADQGTRSAIADQLRRGDDLRKKMQSVNPDSEDDSDDSDDDAEHLDGMTETEKLQHRLQKKAAALVMDIEADGHSTDKVKGLQGMKFMQKAVEKQRERALDEAEALLKELRGDDYDAGDMTDDDDVATKPPPKKKVKVTAADRKIVDKDMVQGSLQTKAVMMDKSHKTRVASAIKIDFDGDGQSSSAVHTEVEADEAVAAVGTPAVPEENPWLSGSKVGKKRRKRHGKHKSEGSASVATAVATLAAVSTADKDQPVTPLLPLNAINKKRKDVSSDAAGLEADDTPQKKAKSSSTSKQPPTAQEELVRKAFAFAEDTENEISKEKELLAARDADVKVGAEVARLTGMEGWGSWAGEGIKPSKRQNARLALAHRTVQEAKEAALAKRKDHKMDAVLINEKKDKKAAKFMVNTVPYPFTSREQYELAMRNPLGSDWNTARASNAMTVPEVMTRAGKIIQPLRLTNEQRAPKPPPKVTSKTARQGKQRKAKF